MAKNEQDGLSESDVKQLLEIRFGDAATGEYARFCSRPTLPGK